VKTLHRYLLRQVAATLVMTVLVFMFVLLLGSALKEILPLLVSGQTSFGMVAKGILLLLPFLLSFALPMAVLTATLLVFGRFSADQELTAARASGVSLLSLITPVLILSLLLCGVSALMNLEIAPRCRVAYNSLRSDLRLALASMKLPEGRYIDLPGKPAFTVYVRKNRKQVLEDITLIRYGDGTNRDWALRAPRGRIETDATNQQAIITLFETKGTWKPDSAVSTLGEFTTVLDLNTPKGERKPSISDMTFTELREEMRRLEKRIGEPLSPPEKPSDDEPREKKRAPKKQSADLTEPLRVQLHQKMAFSFACFGFTLVGIPLAIRMHRRETNIGFAISLGLVAVYFGLTGVAQSLSGRPELAPHLLMWLPNFLFQAVGVVLLWRVNRGL